jgi:LysM repeat protein
MRDYKIPASITLAQGILESGAGNSALAREAKNHFGIKCHKGWSGKTYTMDDDEKNECFRKYENPEESFKDHSLFLTTRDRYAKLFELDIMDYEGWAKGLKACGYATSPVYATRLINIIELYHLDKYDKNGHLDKFQERQLELGDLRHVYFFNDNYYVIARKGDTFRSIAQDAGISYSRLASFNERDKHDPIEEGERIWLKKKRRKAPKEYKNMPHQVRAGESMYSISQQYGIRLKNLYKINNLPPEYAIRVGDFLLLR